VLLPFVRQDGAAQKPCADAEECACAARHFVADFGV
jgi:hypothetical protein